MKWWNLLCEINAFWGECRDNFSFWQQKIWKFSIFLLLPVFPLIFSVCAMERRDEWNYLICAKRSVYSVWITQLQSSSSAVMHSIWTRKGQSHDERKKNDRKRSDMRPCLFVGCAECWSMDTINCNVHCCRVNADSLSLSLPSLCRFAFTCARGDSSGSWHLRRQIDSFNIPT